MAKLTTKEGLKKLKEELEYLKTKKQKKVAERLRKAIAFGDLSENFEYADAKEEQTMLQAKIADLGNAIAEVKVVEDNEKSDKVHIGSTVEVEGAGKQTFTVVTANDADPLQGKISVESPMGEALMGKRVGDKAVVELPAGPMEYKILKIS